MIEVNKYSEQEIIENEVIVINNIVTNVLFNMGQMYSDLVNYYFLENASVMYWNKVGRSIGDFMIRFLYKADFSKTFDFEGIEDCDLTADN